MTRRHLGFAGVCAGVVLLIGSVAVPRLAVAPAMVRFPLNVDETAHYTGHALTYVDEKTLLPLAKPASVPLTVDRHVKVVSGTFSACGDRRDDHDQGRLDHQRRDLPVRHGPAFDEARRRPSLVRVR